MNESAPEEKIVDMGIPADALPEWAESLYGDGKNGLTKSEVMDFVIRVNKRQPQRTPSMIQRLRPAPGDAPGWVTALEEGGFTEQEIDEILERTTIEAKQKMEIQDRIHQIAIQHTEEMQTVPVTILPGKKK